MQTVRARLEGQVREAQAVPQVYVGAVGQDQAESRGAETEGEGVIPINVRDALLAASLALGNAVRSLDGCENDEADEDGNAIPCDVSDQCAFCECQPAELKVDACIADLKEAKEWPE